MASDKTNTPKVYGAFRRVVTPEVLRKLYLEQNDAEIAALYGVSDALVSRYRKQWGIQTLNPRQRRDQVREAQGLPTIEDLTPVVLADIYSRMGDAQIGKMYGVSKPVIVRLRQRWGIHTLTKTQRATQEGPLSEGQQETLIGVLLGDGHVTARGSFQVGHSHSQVGYVHHLYDLWAPLSRPVQFGEKIMDSGTVAYTFLLRTAPHKWLQYLRKLFYPQGVKVFPESILTHLSARSLAYWYFDDGHLDSGLPSIALGDITVAAADDVARRVGKRFGLDAYIRPQSTETCKILGVRAGSTDLFFSLVRSYLIPEMAHKYPAKQRPVGTVPVRPRLTLEPVKMPLDLTTRSKEWGHLGEEGQEHLLDDLVAFWHQQGFPYPTPKIEDLDVVPRITFQQSLRDDTLKRINAGQSICMTHMPHMWGVKAVGAAVSPLDVFQDKTLFRGALKMILGMKGVPNAARVRSGVRLYRYGGAYNFRPVTAKVLLDRFCPTGGLVFDPCGGWGGRMLGALLSNPQPRYEACEPQPETCAGLLQLRDWVNQYLPGARGRAVVHRSPAEDWEFPAGVDVVLTSPPYWKKMVYGPQSELAGNKFPSYQSWLEGFWKVVLQKAVRALKVGGWLLLNVDDVTIDGTLCPLVEDTRRLVHALGLGEPAEVYKYDMGKPGDRDNHEPVMCWSKGPPSVEAVSESSLKTPKCAKCGRIVTSGTALCSRCQEPEVFCDECGQIMVRKRHDARFCSEACGARNRRRRKRVLHPPKKARTFTCQSCGAQWETEALGSFRYCPSCREEKDLEGRQKVCAYRECRRHFVDTSPKNCMSYCHPEHRRREKVFRSGKAAGVSHFRKPDPVLE